MVLLTHALYTAKVRDGNAPRLGARHAEPDVLFRFKIDVEPNLVGELPVDRAGAGERANCWMRALIPTRAWVRESVS